MPRSPMTRRDLGLALGLITLFYVLLYGVLVAAEWLLTVTGVRP